MHKSIPCRIENGQPVFDKFTLARFVEGKEGKTFDLIQRETTRTSRQNRALHLWFTMVAEALNDAGLDMQIVLGKKMSLSWTGETVKDVLWRSAQKALLRKESTTQLKKGEIDPVFEHLNRHLGTLFGLHIPFPAYESEEEFINETTRTE